MNQKKLDDLVDILADEHLRQRIEPRPGDSLYLHLSDLLLALKAHATDAKLDILDFGAGSSPYRSLFPKANYRRADFAIGTGKGLDFVLNESLQVAAPDNSFDLVLSTQVLEHVEQPENYLKECLRLLRPGGKLVLTTHGIYADHPCPLDLHRWTADGLAALCKKSGFEVVATNKLTVGPRALLFLHDAHGRSLHRREFSFFSAVFALFYRLHLLFRRSLHRWADRFFPDSRVVKNQSAVYEIYINILVHAAKPAGS
jgi:SAM-dependent methyltransferase